MYVGETMTNADRVRAWLLEGRPVWGANLWSTTDAMYSYRMCIAQRLDNWKAIMLVRKGPTKTTQKHINLVNEVARNLGFDVGRLETLQICQTA